MHPLAYEYEYECHFIYKCEASQFPFWGESLVVAFSTVFSLSLPLSRTFCVGVTCQVRSKLK